MVDQSRFLEYEGTSFLQGVVVDVTETVELRNMMRILMEHTPNDIVLLSWSDRELVPRARGGVRGVGEARSFLRAVEKVVLDHLYARSEEGERRLVD